MKSQIKKLIEKEDKLFHEDKLDEAMKIIDELTHLDPKNPIHYGKKAAIYFKKEEFRQALECYDKALSIRSDKYFSYMKALALLGAGRRDESEIAMKAVLEDEDLINSAKSFLEDIKDLNQTDIYKQELQRLIQIFDKYRMTKEEISFILFLYRRHFIKYGTEDNKKYGGIQKLMDKCINQEV